MDPLSPVFVLLCLPPAGFLAWMLVRGGANAGPVRRFASLDGLRGGLALLVLVHHAAIWRDYLRSGVWTTPGSVFYAQCGAVAVALFFMITGLLFVTRLLEARDGRPVDWLQLYAGRVLRIYPLHLVVGALAGVVVVWLSGGAALRLPAGDLLRAALNWCSFNFLHLRVAGLDLGGAEAQWVVADVIWTLRYEWLFYVALPVLALVLRVRVPAGLALSGAVGLALLIRIGPGLGFQACFLSGLLAAFAVRDERVRRLARSRMSTLALSATVGALLFLPISPFVTPAGLGLTTFLFIGLAAGNDLGGLLSSRGARLLGEASYGIYLLHGLALFVTFEVVLGRVASLALSPLAHWLVVAALVPLVVGAACLSHRWLEVPCQRQAGRLAAWIRRLPPFRSGAAP
jgi:peptidoglycan/LPS O-acetylase OafA/YrhL